MSIIIQLQNLPWSASSADIRNFFHGLKIPSGGVHIVGGEKGCAFIAFDSKEDARRALKRDGCRIASKSVKLFSSSLEEMKCVIQHFHLDALENNLTQQCSLQINSQSRAFEENYCKPCDSKASRSENDLKNHRNLGDMEKKDQFLWNGISTKESIPNKALNHYRLDYSETCVSDFGSKSRMRNMPSYKPSDITSVSNNQFNCLTKEDELQEKMGKNELLEKAKSFLISLGKDNLKFSTHESSYTENKYLQAFACPLNVRYCKERETASIGQYGNTEFDANSIFPGKKITNVYENFVDDHHQVEAKWNGEYLANHFSKYGVRKEMLKDIAGASNLMNTFGDGKFMDGVCTEDTIKCNTLPKSNFIDCNNMCDNLMQQREDNFFQAQDLNSSKEADSSQNSTSAGSHCESHLWKRNFNFENHYNRSVHKFLQGGNNQTSHFCYVRISGLHFVANFKDIQFIMRKFSIPQHHVKFESLDEGYDLIAAYIKLSDQGDLNNIFSNREKYFNGRHVQISQCSNSIYNGISNEKISSLFAKYLNCSNPQNRRFYSVVKGLPHSASTVDLFNLFHDLNIVDAFIKYDSIGRATGTAFVEFATLEDLNAAIKVNRFRNGHNIEVFESTEDQMNVAKICSDNNYRPKVNTDFSHNFMDDQPVMNTFEKWSSVRPLSKDLTKQSVTKSKKRRLCVLLAGLPKFVRNKQIRNFCSESGIIPHAIHILLNDCNQPCGRAFIEFLDPFDLDAVLKRVNPTIGGHTITVKQVLYEEMLNILENRPSRHNFVSNSSKLNSHEKIPKKVPYLWIPPDDNITENSCTYNTLAALRSNNDNESQQKSAQEIIESPKVWMDCSYTSDYNNIQDVQNEISDVNEKMSATGQHIRTQKVHLDERNSVPLFSSFPSDSAVKEDKSKNLHSKFVENEADMVYSERLKKCSFHKKCRHYCSRHKNKNSEYSENKKKSKNIYTRKHERNTKEKLARKESEVRGSLKCTKLKKPEEFSVSPKSKMLESGAKSSRENMLQKKDEEPTQISPKKKRKKILSKRHVEHKKNCLMLNEDCYKSPKRAMMNTYNEYGSYFDPHQTSSLKFSNSRCVVQASIDPMACLNDLLDFFSGFDICGDDIIQRYSHDGLPTGDIRIAFHSPEDAERAILYRNFKYLLEKPVIFYKI